MGIQKEGVGIVTGQKVSTQMTKLLKNFGFALLCWLTLSQVATKHFLVETEDTGDENLEDYSDYPDKELIAKKDMATVLDALAESGKKGGKLARDKYSKMNTTMQHKLQKKLHSAYGEDVDAKPPPCPDLSSLREAQFF